MSQQDHRILWLDMEMSGLDVKRERILEVACLVTDGELEVIGEGPELVLYQEDALLESMDAWNREHHGASGLTERVRASQLRESEVEAELLRFAKRWGGARTLPLGGNSIHQDRKFLERYMPEFENYLHYRNIDVSTTKELAKRWYGEAFAAMPKKRETHRAMDDIRESIDELRYYRRTIFAR